MTMMTLASPRIRTSSPDAVAEPRRRAGPAAPGSRPPPKHDDQHARSPRMPTVVSQIATPPPSGVGARCPLCPPGRSDEPPPRRIPPHQRAEARAQRERRADQAERHRDKHHHVIQSSSSDRFSIDEHECDLSITSGIVGLRLVAAAPGIPPADA